MSLTASVDAVARVPQESGDPASVVASWASGGGFDEYVVFDRGGRWTFAGGDRVRIVLTPDVVRVAECGASVEMPWVGKASTALSRAVESLETVEWQALGYVNFDYYAAGHGLRDRVPAGTVLAHLIVPEFSERLRDGEPRPAAASLPSERRNDRAVRSCLHPSSFVDGKSMSEGALT